MLCCCLNNLPNMFIPGVYWEALTDTARGSRATVIKPTGRSIGSGTPYPFSSSAPGASNWAESSPARRNSSCVWFSSSPQSAWIDEAGGIHAGSLCSIHCASQSGRPRFTGVLFGWSSLEMKGTTCLSPTLTSITVERAASSGPRVSFNCRRTLLQKVTLCKGHSCAVQLGSIFRFVDVHTASQDSPSMRPYRSHSSSSRLKVTFCNHVVPVFGSARSL